MYPPTKTIGVAGAKQSITFVGESLVDLGADATQIFLNDLQGRIEVQQVLTVCGAANKDVSSNNGEFIRHPQ
jgi:hypothetical protein